MALSVPRLWSRLALVFTWHGSWCRCNRPPTASNTRNIYNPRSNSGNYDLTEELLLRSKQLPLDVSFRGCHAYCPTFLDGLRPHRSRISRLHFATGDGRSFEQFAYDLGELPVLRTLTAGFDDEGVEYSDLPARTTAGARFPALRQVHLGAAASCRFVPWDQYPMPGLQELTLTLTEMQFAAEALLSCTNLTCLTLVMAAFVPAKHESLYTKMRLRRCVDALAHVPELCFSDISIIHEKFLLTHFNDARFRNLTLDYMGRERRPGSSWYLSLPSPCDALSNPVRLTLKLRDGVYEITGVDSNGLRREIFLDRDTIRMAPGLWNCYLKKKIVASATVDAVAWDYFADELPYTCSIPELALVVLQHPSELLGVSLAHFAKLHKLRIDVGKRGMTFDSDRAVVQKLVESRGDEEPLAVLSLSSNATYGEEMEKVATVLEYV